MFYVYLNFGVDIQTPYSMSRLCLFFGTTVERIESMYR
jgi:hypothetical protein